MKLLIRLFVFIGLASLIVGFVQKFFGIVVVFDNIKPSSHVLFANTSVLIALVLKLAND